VKCKAGKTTEKKGYVLAKVNESASQDPIRSVLKRRKADDVRGKIRLILNLNLTRLGVLDRGDRE